MSRIARALAASALVSTLAACVITGPQQRPAGPTPHALSVDRLHRVEGRIDNLGRRLDTRVNEGYYAQPQGAAVHRRLDEIRREAHDMAAQHGGGLSPDEERVLNEELDTAARAIGE
ncbi:hypothetical protein ACFPTO_10210 [Paraburkholderia denitrificans]|uniref:Lipoprotein n=1 Tax=Paraburkholderia denitrificans TaxID=694025 RepID=A0ABW0J7X6_9BURK